MRTSFRARPGLRGDPDLDWGGETTGEQLPVPVAINGRSVLIPAPDGDADVKIVCGFFGCDLQPFNPLITALPRLLHLPATDGHAWIAGFTQQAVVGIARAASGRRGDARANERDDVRRCGTSLRGSVAGREPRAGSPACVIASSVARSPSCTSGRRMRGRSTSWGVRVGLSRSALHERFVDLVGVPPMHYLAQWRMQASARLLLETRATVAAIALEVGYDSEAAFARAFKRSVGKPPAAWRRERERGAD